MANKYNQYFIIFILALVVSALVLASACEKLAANYGIGINNAKPSEKADEKVEADGYNDATPEEEAQIEVEGTKYIIDETSPEKDSAGPVYTQKQAEKDAKNHIYPILPGEPRRKMTLDLLDVRRISRDEAMIKNIEFTVRNLDEDEYIPVVIFRMQGRARGEPSLLEEKFELPKLKKGMKFTNKFPAKMYFKEVDREKILEVAVYKKFSNPREIVSEFVYKFIPSAVWKSDEIKWV